MKNRYQIKIIGKDPKRVIKNLIKSKILLYHMENHEKFSMIIVDDEGLKFLKKMKTSYQIQVVKEFGMIRLSHLLKKYAWFIGAICLGILMIQILSHMIFQIEIEHSKSEIRELVLNDLETYGIKKYHFVVSYQKKEEIKKKILAKETERIEWLEIEQVGTKYIIKVEERIKNEVPESKTSQNIIAKKDAMITKIIATHGEVVKKRYDYVKKGDVLISGFIKRDDKIVSKTKAEGIVLGEVWYQVKVDLPKKYQVVHKTGKKKKKMEIKLFQNHFYLFDFSPYKTYKVKRKTLIKDNIFPISIHYATIYETHEIFKNYDHDNAEKEAIEIASRKLSDRFGKKDRIISKKVLKKTEKNSRIIVDVFFKVEEDIQETENIENIKIEDIEGEEDEPSN